MSNAGRPLDRSASSQSDREARPSPLETGLQTSLQARYRRVSASWPGLELAVPAISGYSATAGSGRPDPAPRGGSENSAAVGTPPELRRRRAQDHRGHPGAARDREDPHAPSIAGQGAPTLSCPRSIAASGLTTIPMHRSSCGPSPGPRGLPVPGLGKAAQLGSSHQGKPTIQAAGMRIRTGSTAFGRSPSGTKTSRRASTDGCWPPHRGPSATKSAFERLILACHIERAG